MVKRDQKCSKDGPDRPKPLPNGAQDPPKSIFKGIFWPLFYHSKFALIFHRFFVWFFLIFKSWTLTKHCVGARILKIGDFQENAKNLRKILPKPSQNPFKILPKSMKNPKKSIKNAMMASEAENKRKNYEKMRKSAKNDPTRRGTKSVGGLRVASSRWAKPFPQRKLVKDRWRK